MFTKFVGVHRDSQGGGGGGAAVVAEAVNCLEAMVNIISRWIRKDV